MSMTKQQKLYTCFGGVVGVCALALGWFLYSAYSDYQAALEGDEEGTEGLSAAKEKNNKFYTQSKPFPSTDSIKQIESNKTVYAEWINRATVLAARGDCPPPPSDLDGTVFKQNLFEQVTRMQKYPGSDIRMWAHYTNQGMGVRFEIDTEKLQFLPEAVRYSCEAPKLDLSTVNHIRELADFSEDCIITKHKIWEPEQEARIIFRGPNEAVCFDPEIKMHRWPLPLNSVTKIAIGEALLKSPEIHVILQHIRNEIRWVRPTISIVAATRNYNTYDIDYVPIAHCA